MRTPAVQMYITSSAAMIFTLSSSLTQASLNAHTQTVYTPRRSPRSRTFLLPTLPTMSPSSPVKRAAAAKTPAAPPAPTSAESSAVSLMANTVPSSSTTSKPVSPSDKAVFMPHTRTTPTAAPLSAKVVPLPNSTTNAAMANTPVTDLQITDPMALEPTDAVADAIVNSAADDHATTPPANNPSPGAPPPAPTAKQPPPPPPTTTTPAPPVNNLASGAPPPAPTANHPPPPPPTSTAPAPPANNPAPRAPPPASQSNQHSPLANDVAPPSNQPPPVANDVASQVNQAVHPHPQPVHSSDVGMHPDTNEAPPPITNNTPSLPTALSSPEELDEACRQELIRRFNLHVQGSTSARHSDRAHTPGRPFQRNYAKRKVDVSRLCPYGDTKKDWIIYPVGLMKVELHVITSEPLRPDMNRFSYMDQTSLGKLWNIFSKYHPWFKIPDSIPCGRTFARDELDVIYLDHMFNFVNLVENTSVEFVAKDLPIFYLRDSLLGRRWNQFSQHRDITTAMNYWYRFGIWIPHDTLELRMHISAATLRTIHPEIFPEWSALCFPAGALAPAPPALFFFYDRIKNATGQAKVFWKRVLEHEYAHLFLSSWWHECERGQKAFIVPQWTMNWLSLIHISEPTRPY